MKPSRQNLLLVFLAFLIFFIPRVAGLGWDITNYDERYWRPRMRNFTEAIEEGDWKETYQKYHPGVTLMWLSGFAERSFDLAAEKTIGRNLRLEAKWYPWRHFVAKFPLVFAISVLGAVCFWLIRKFTDTKFALIFAFLLSLEPFFLGTTSFLHLSGLTAMLMFTSFLLIFAHISHRHFGACPKEEGQALEVPGLGSKISPEPSPKSLALGNSGGPANPQSDNLYFFASAILLGLAVLTKMDGAIAGVANLILLLFGVFRAWANLKSIKLWKKYLGRAVVYGLIAFLAFFVFWPAIWFDPVGIIRKMISEGIYDTAFSSSGAAMLLPWRWLYYFETFFFRSLPTTVVLVLLFPLLFFRRGGRSKELNLKLGNRHPDPDTVGRRISFLKRFFGLRPQNDVRTFECNPMRFGGLIKAVLLYLLVVWAFFAFPDKTKDRYLIDFYPPLAVLAAFSLCWILELAVGINISVIPNLFRNLVEGGRQTPNRVQSLPRTGFGGDGIVQWFILGLLAGFYLLTIYRYHPVYSFYYNDIIGGAAGIEKLGLPVKHRGEFYAQAAQFINRDSKTRYPDEPTGNLNTITPNRNQDLSFKPYFYGKTFTDSKFMPDGYHAHYVVTRKDKLDRVPETCELVATFGPRAPWQYNQLYTFSCARTVDNSYKFKN